MSGSGLYEPSPVSSSIAGILGHEVDGSGSPVKVQSYEFRRDLITSTWESIKVGSLDWHEITSQHANALVVRVSSIVNENEPDEVMERLHNQDFAADSPEPALHVVCMFKEFAVSESSPVRFTANFLFIFPQLGNALPSQFKAAIRKVLSDRSISYITAEMLGSFLARRDYEAHAITKQEAQEKLAQFIRDREPCSSFFLKMSPVVPEFCRLLLLELSEGDARELIGVRAIHKLAISCTSSSMASQHNFLETMAVMKTGVHPNHWNFVVFKTLMRLATKNDKLQRKHSVQGDHRGEDDRCQVAEMLDLIAESHLDPLEKLAVRIISSADGDEKYRNPDRELSEQDIEQEALVDFMVRTITSEKDYLSNEDFKKLLNMIEDGRPAACHLTGVLLEKCIEEENFNIGWRVASTVESVNEHTIEEVVTLCSKAFFKYSRNQQQEANKWFNRVKWCFERHHKLLGKYPSGLALHVAAHRRDFDLCWRWFLAKKEDRAFRFSAHHTSSILKAASYAPEPALHMKEVLQAYDMTPSNQKSAFVFEPLVHLWNSASSRRDEYRAFWATVESDLRSYLERELKDPDPQDRKMRKLAHWDRVLASWSMEGSDPNSMGLYPISMNPDAQENGRRGRHANSTWTPTWNGNPAFTAVNVHSMNLYGHVLKHSNVMDENAYNRTSPVYHPHLAYPGYTSLWKSAEHVNNGITGGSSVWSNPSPSGATLTLDASAAAFRPGGNVATTWSNNQSSTKFRHGHLHNPTDEPLVDWSAATSVVGRSSPSIGSVASPSGAPSPIHEYRPAFTRSFADPDLNLKQRQARFNDPDLSVSPGHVEGDEASFVGDAGVPDLWPARSPHSSTASWPHAVGLPL